MTLITQSRLEIFVSCLIVVLIIHIYGYIKDSSYDPFKVPLLNKPFDFVDGWSLTHTMFYFVLAFMYPKEYILIFMIGVIWECMECTYSYMRSDGWWIGRWQDILMNAIGIAFGLMLRNSIS